MILIISVINGLVVLLSHAFLFDLLRDDIGEENIFLGKEQPSRQVASDTIEINSTKPK